METLVIHPKDQAQQKALQTFLEGYHIPYQNEPEMDETERIESIQETPFEGIGKPEAL